MDTNIPFPTPKSWWQNSDSYLFNESCLREGGKRRKVNKEKENCFKLNRHLWFKDSPTLLDIGEWESVVIEYKNCPSKPCQNHGTNNKYSASRVQGKRCKTDNVIQHSQKLKLAHPVKTIQVNFTITNVIIFSTNNHYNLKLFCQLLHVLRRHITKNPFYHTFSFNHFKAAMFPRSLLVSVIGFLHCSWCCRPHQNDGQSIFTLSQ